MTGALYRDGNCAFNSCCILEETRRRFGLVQGADQLDNLIIGGATEPLLIVGDPLGEPQQRRPARRAVGPAGDPPRGPGLPGAAAATGHGLGGQRPQESPPGEIPDVGSVLLPGARTALGHVHGGGSQFFSMWVMSSTPR